MSLFEYIMNCIGKRVFHLLFLVSAFLSCRACAAYFYNSEKNFKCPICVLLKGVQPHSTLVYSEFANTIPCDKCDEDILSTAKEKTELFTNSHFNISLVLFSSKSELIPHYILTKHFASVKRYLLFKQLKIGGFYQIIKT